MEDDEQGECCRPEGDALPVAGLSSQAVGSKFSRRRA